MQDMKFISTNELLQEILSRFDHAIFIGIRCLDMVKKEGDITRIETSRKWKGNSYTCAGMAMEIGREILENFRVREKEEDDT